MKLKFIFNTKNFSPGLHPGQREASRLRVMAVTSGNRALNGFRQRAICP